MTEETNSAADGDIIFHRQGGLANVMLNRPKALNALTQPMAVMSTSTQQRNIIQVCQGRFIS